MQDLDLQAVSQRMNLIATELQEEVRQTNFLRTFGAGLTSLLCWGCEPTH